MNSFETYEYYLAVERHFKSNYNFHERNGKVKCSVTSFKNNRVRDYFIKMAKFKDVKGLILSSFVGHEEYWTADLFSHDSMLNYKAWKKRKESLKYTISQEIESLENLEDLLVVNDSHPGLLVKYLRQEISIETICIVLEITGCFPYWNKRMKDDILWQKQGMKMKKYIPFITFDRDYFTTLIKEKLNRNAA